MDGGELPNAGFIREARLIERAGRTAYKSEDKISDTSYDAFIRGIIKRKHEAVLEFGSMMVKFLTNRGVTHELVRHRLCSFVQESTRYVDSSSVRNIGTWKFEFDQDFIDAYEQGYSMRQIAEQADKKEWDVRKLLLENHVEIRGLNNKGKIDHDFFNKIDTVEKAYLLGMIEADGSVHPRVKQFTITQHKDYAWYLEAMMSSFIRKNVEVLPDRNCYQLSIGSNRLVEALLSHGIVPNKSHNQTAEQTNTLWKAIPEYLKPSFIRGFLDGDGSVLYWRGVNSSNTLFCNIQFANNNIHLLELIHDWVLTNFNYRGTIRRVTKKANCYSYSIHTPEVARQFGLSILSDFKYPFGHPAKTFRWWEQLQFDAPVAEFGDDNFKVIQTSIPSGTYSFWIWLRAMWESEQKYTALRNLGQSPQIARGLLPNDLKTEIVVRANFREWRHIFRLRALSHSAHPDMRTLMIPLYLQCRELLPYVFEMGDSE
jgi:thymidylate synthase ThyX